MSWPRTMMIIALTCLGGGTLLWGLYSADDGVPEEPVVEVPKELSVERLTEKVESDDVGTLQRTMRETMNREDLTDEQRRKVGQNFGEVFRAQMKKRTDEYFDAAEEERDAILDRHIDEFQEMRERWRAERERERAREGDEEQERSDRRRWWGSQTQQERKARSETRSPDEMARMMKYFSAMRQRAEERGIDMRWGRGGRDGGRRGRP